MKRLMILLVTITAALLFLQSGVRGAEIEPIYLSPRPASQLVQAESTIAFRFAEAVDAGTVKDTKLHVSGTVSGDHEGDLFVALDDRTLIFEPEEPFAPAETVHVRLNPGLLSIGGNELSVADYEFTIASRSEEVSHPVQYLLAQDMLGMRAPLADLLNKGASENSYVTVPDSFPEITVTTPANGTDNGYIFVSNFVIDWSNRGAVAESRPYLLILDNKGDPVFYREMTPERRIMDFKKQPNGLLTYAEWNGIHFALDETYTIVKTYAAKNGYHTDIHDFQILPDDHVLINIYDMKRVDMTAYGGKPDAIVTGLVIQEQDPDGNVVFQWRSWDHFAFEESAANLTGQYVDPVHGNSFELDHDGNLIISSRRMNEVTKIDRQTGEIIWRLGGKANEFTFVNDPERFFSQHDARRLANGNITIFDNHDIPDSTFSRAVEYELNETGPDKTATLVWEYRSSPAAPALGNAQRLPNGNTMIGWGTHYPTLTEVKPNGEIAFELTFTPPAEPNLNRNSYRAFRFDWQGKPTTEPMLVAKDESPGIVSLYTSWNGATDVAAYRVYGGRTAERLYLLKSEERDGFETEILIADAAEEYCVFKVMPVDKDGKETRYSNIVQVRECAVADPAVTISEIRIDQPSDNNDEYFELAGEASTSLNDLTYIVLGDSTAGGSGVVENVTPLTGQSMPSSGYFVAAEATFTLGTADMTTTLNFEYSDNVTHMLVEGFTGADGDDLDTNDDGVLDVTPWTSVVDRVGLIKEENPPTTTEWHYGPPTVGPDGSYVPGHVYYCADGMEWNIGPFDPTSGKDTPGAANPCGGGGEFGECGDPATLIHEVQGDGASSPKVGEVVVVEAVVHGDFQEADELEAYFLQEEDDDADSDPKTSEGLYIDDVSLAVAESDLVRVQGEVEENYGRTQLTDIIETEICSSGEGVTPAEITLPVPSMDRWEESEGMMVLFSQTLYASDNYNQGRYGEVTLSVDGRLYNPTNVVPPGAPANAMQAANDLRRILLDDGSSNSNPEPPPYFAADGTLRAGDTVEMLVAALDYGFSTYRLQPTEEVAFTRVNERTDAPADVGGNLTVASFNVLNYFTTIDEGQDNCGPSGDLECRGADSEEEFVRQRTKIIAAISSMDADVVGLIEIENNATAAVADLVSGLNDGMGAGTYAYVDTGTIGSDAIKVAFIYKPATVDLVGEYKILDSSVDPDFDDTKNRPALAQTFAEKATGEKFTAVVNHLKSKGSDCDDLGDPDTGDGQGNCNKTRTSAAAAEAEWLAADATMSEDPDVLIIGGLNAYAMEDPITALKDAGYRDLVAWYEGMYAYSYVFFGQAGYLDHSLANRAMAPQVVGTTVWHINADEPNALNYNDYNQDGLYKPDAFRASDHDPVIVGLNLGQYPVYLPIVLAP